MIILFESYIYPETRIEEYKSNSKCILDYAAHNLSKAIYEGLKENDSDVRLVNVPNIGSFPSYYKSPFVNGATIKDGVSLSFCNITYIKRYDIKRKLFRSIVKELDSIHPSERVTLLIYNYRCLPFLAEIKKKRPEIKIVMIVTDLPGFMIMEPSKLMEMGKKIIGHRNICTKENLENVDGFVLLAPEMKNALDIKDKPWILVEGIYNNDTKVDITEKSRNKVIMYSGNLNLRYGIGTLLEAFRDINDKDYRLWICGDGDGLPDVLKYASEDCRIEYKGILQRYDVLKLQKQATILINPRKSKDEYTKFSFPSKTMEYLASGTPVVMSHLASIPQEYDNHIFYIDNESVGGMKEKIISVCSLSSEMLTKRGENAAAFVRKEKTPKPQTKKIIDLIESIFV